MKPKHDSSPGFYVILSPAGRALKEAREELERSRESTPPGTPASPEDRALFKLFESMDHIEQEQKRIIGEMAEARTLKGKLDYKTLTAAFGLVMTIGGLLLGYLDSRIKPMVGEQIAIVTDKISDRVRVLEREGDQSSERLTMLTKMTTDLRDEVREGNRTLVEIKIQIAAMQPRRRP